MRNADTSSPSAIRGPAREPARALDPRGRLGLPARAARALQPASRPRLRLRRGRGDHVQGLGCSISKISAFLQKFANFWQARSRLYHNETWQGNMRLIAFFKLYKICILLHRCNLKILEKNRFEKSASFVNIQQTFCKCCNICKILQI